MHINIRDILAESVGYNRTYKITGERPVVTEVRLTQDVTGEITVSRLENGVHVRGRVATGIELECHRCLRSFNHSTDVSFSQVFAEQPGDEEFPIEGDIVDLAPLIEQEIILSLPIKILCQPDCPGIEGITEKYTKVNTASRLQDQAHITKGS